MELSCREAFALSYLNVFEKFNVNVAPKYLEINRRLFHDILLMSAYTRQTKEESGGFVIRGKHGHIGVVAVQIGKDREINLYPSETLYSGEEYLGTYHAHPVTNTFSIADVATFLYDRNEKISLNSGDDNSINATIKTPQTIQISKEDISFLEKNFKQEDIAKLANIYHFLYYKGKSNSRILELQNDGMTTTEKEMFDDFVRNIRGLPRIPRTWVKKKPKVHQYLFSE